MCFSPYLGVGRTGGGGGLPRDWYCGTQLADAVLMRFFTLDSSKIEVFQTYLFDTLIS